MNEPAPAKRPRLSLACNECRRRKVKCDAAYPKCRNCTVRNSACITTDPRRAGYEVTREWIHMVENPDQPQHSEFLTSRRGSVTVSQRSGELSATELPTATHATTHTPSGTPQAQNNSSVNNELEGISPVQQPYDMAFNTDHSTDRIKMLGGSSSQCLMKSLDVFMKSVNIQPLANRFIHGMRHAEEMEIPLAVCTPAFPEPHRLESYLSTFFNKIHPVYPMFEVDEFKSSVHGLASISNLGSVSHENVPFLAAAYLTLSLGADEAASAVTELGTQYLRAATSLLGHVVLMPYLPAVQTLLLFTVAYRGRNKDGVGWQTLGMGIRIAYTLGLHRHSATNPSSEHGVQHRGTQLLHARIWAICCSLEKLMQIESGRPSLIGAVDCDQMMGRDQHPRGHDFLQWHMGLAQNQGLISEHLYGHGVRDRGSRRILLDTARLDRSLLAWASDLPEEFRPGNDLFCPSHEYHIAALLSIQYFQTMICLHRAALISPASRFQSEVDKHCSDDPFRLRLRGGEEICISSARSIAKLATELSDRDIESRILTAGPVLLACIVLGISLLKNPGRRLKGADLELMKACVDYTSQQYTKSGHNAEFARGITSIYEQISSHATRSPQKSLVSTDRPATAPSAHPPAGSQASGTSGWERSHGTGQASITSDVTPYQPIRNLTNGHYGAEILTLQDFNQPIYSDVLPFDNLDIEEIWNWMSIENMDSTQTNQYSWK